MEHQTEQKDMDAKLASPSINKKRIFRGKVHNLSTLEAIRVIKRKLNPSQIKRFEASCFGKLLHMSTDIKFSGQLVHHLLSRQVNHPNKDEMWFLIGNKRARFSKDEFALVTGLNCGRKCPHPHGTTQSTRLADKYFHGQSVIRTKCLKHQFLSCEDDDDAVRLSLVYFLQALLLTREWRASIDRHWLSLVDDLESFNRFPWGELCYERTLLSMKKIVMEKFEEADSTVKPMSPKYTLRGFPYAFQIWAYEAIPLLGIKFAERSSRNLIPRILCWESTQSTAYDKLHKIVFGVKNLRVLETLRATEREREEDYMKAIVKSSFEPRENDSHSHDDTKSYGDSSESKSMEFMTTVKKRKKHSKQKGMDAKVNHFFSRDIKNLSTLDAIRVIKGKLNPSQLERFESSCFGKIFGTNIKFSGQIVHHLLLRQVDHPNEDEMWFLIGGKRARFSLSEFALVTGLNCGRKYPSRTDPDGTGTTTRLVDKYFSGRKLIYTRCLKEQFLCCEDEEDSYRLSLVYFLQALLLARDDKSSIDKRWLFLVDDLESFEEFPWGKLCYERTLLSLKKRARTKFEENGSENDMGKPKQKQCTLHGFPFAFQIWAYEAIPRLGSFYAEKNTNLIPRILCWERTQSPSFKELHRNVFGVKNLRVLETLRATELEREQDYMKAMEKNDSESTESCLELGEEYDDDDISWRRGKINRKRREKANNVPFPFTEYSKKQKLVTEANGNLNSNHGIDSMEINQPLEKNNNCNLQTSVQECLGRDNAFMGNGDKGAQHSNGSRIDLDTSVSGGSLYNKPLPPRILEYLDVIIQHEIDLDFARGFRQSSTVLNGGVAETEVVVLSDND